MKKLSTQEFISKCIEIYGDVYDYTPTTYKGSKAPVTVTCKIHGDFSKSPNLMLAKRSGCPDCGNAKKGQHNKLSGKLVQDQLEEKYPSYAPFRLLGEYSRNTDGVVFNCSKHGEQKAKVSYLRWLKQPTPCPVCNVELSTIKKRIAQEDFIASCKETHGDKYDYSQAVYITSQDKFTVVCSDHGPFEVVAMSHKLGTGCAKCYFEAQKDTILPYAEWLSRAIAVHGDTYVYDEASYAGISDKIRITCKEHGEFWQVGTYHAAGSRCPTCASTNSKGQIELTEFLRSLGVEVITDHRIGEGKLEVDCYLPEFKLAIEYDGLKWHSTQHRPPSYHTRKRAALESQGVQLIRVFEDEWQHRNSQVKSLLVSRLGKATCKVYARKCAIVSVPNELAREFYELNHIQGWRRTGTHLGLQYSGQLVAVMTFTQNLSERCTNAGTTWELARFASTAQVVGGASKLFKALLDATKAAAVVSYSDDRLFTGRMYESIGFSLHSKVSPSYTYWRSGQKTRLHKSHFRHSKLPTLLGSSYNPAMTERENCEAAGYYQVYDCGLTKWVWQSTT